MEWHLALLLSDWLVWIVFACILLSIIYIRKQPHLKAPWIQLTHHRLGMIAAVVLSLFVIIFLLDSIHLQVSQLNNQQVRAEKQVSVFDLMVYPLGEDIETTYSAPFSLHAYNKSLIRNKEGKEVRGYAPLKYAGYGIHTLSEKHRDIASRLFMSVVIAVVSFVLIYCLAIAIYSWRTHKHYLSTLRSFLSRSGRVVWPEIIYTLFFLWLILCCVRGLCYQYHLFGTTQVGVDVFYEAIKSIRTGMMIGILTTIFMLPFALILGTIAGYFRGWVDDLIQYIYTTLSSIPGVLLISASVLVMQVYIAKHQALFPTLASRADIRLVLLCLILGLTSWATLCRLLRADTLKIRDFEFIQAAKTMGVKPLTIVVRHIIPNVMYIVLITLVLDFSGLVLAEAVLSYVGVGVDTTTMSWGNMINSARLELAREPVVWWPLAAAFVFMFALVLSANVFADAVRQCQDDRL